MMKFLCCLLMMILIVSYTLSSELKILNLPEDNPGPASCALTCSGVSRYNETGTYRWQIYERSERKAYKPADTTGCGFVSVPVVTAVVRGATPYCPPIRLWYVHKTNLGVITVEDATVEKMGFYQCDVYWIATGYTC